MKMTLNELKNTVRKIIEASYSDWFNDERTSKYRDAKRAEQEEPWKPDTRTGTLSRQSTNSMTKLHHADVDKQYDNAALELFDHYLITDEDEFDDIEFYSTNNKLKAHAKSDNTWWEFGGANGWKEIATESHSLTLQGLREIIKEEWDNASIMGKARHRRMNPRAYDRKEQMRQFYANRLGKKEPAPQATGPDPSGTPSPRRAWQAKLDSVSYRDANDLFPDAVKEMSELYSNPPEDFEYFLDSDGNLWATDEDTDEGMMWDEQRKRWGSY